MMDPKKNSQIQGPSVVNMIRNDASIRITSLGLLTNAAMAAAKGLGGWSFDSQTLIADGLHSLTDLFEDCLTLYTVFWSTRSLSSRSSLDLNLARLGAGSIGAIFLAGGLARSFSCVLELLRLHQRTDNSGPFVKNSMDQHRRELYNLNAIWVAVASMAVKEWLYRTSKSVLSA